MEEIKVYNTLTKDKTVFKPVTPGEVKIYVCGVTPYNHPHIGNARPAVTWDVIRRYLTYVGYKVTLVQTIRLSTRPMQKAVTGRPFLIDILMLISRSLMRSM